MAVILLFSSNIRPQYEQDIIDAAAAPAGSLMRFRYDRKYVAPDLLRAWTSGTLVGRSALVVYSIQQPANYHPAAYVPIRHGTVMRAYDDGSIRVIEFRLDAYGALELPAPGETAGDVVRKFTQDLAARVQGHPGHDVADLRFSAVEGDVLGVLAPTGETDSAQFERLVGYLTNTVSFKTHLFWRVSSIIRVGGNASLTADDQGRFHLTNENTYELILGQYQTSTEGLGASGRATFDVATDTSLLEIVGGAQFTIASSYDSIPIRLRVPALSARKETVLTIRPSTGVNGPQAAVRFVVGPTTRRRGATAAAGAAAALLLVIPDLAGETAPVLVRFGPHALAAALLAGLGWWAVPGRTK